MYPLAPVTHIVWPDREVEAEATPGFDKVVVRRPAADALSALFRKSLRDEVLADRASACYDKKRPASRTNDSGGALFIFAVAIGTSETQVNQRVTQSKACKNRHCRRFIFGLTRLILFDSID